MAGRTNKRLSIPVGLEQVLYTGALDPTFRAELLARRVEAVERRGWQLTPSERAMLAAIPREQLLANMERVDTSAENLHRRSFLRAVAAGAMVVSAVEVMGCEKKDRTETYAGIPPGPDAATGIRPDMGADSTGPGDGNPGSDGAVGEALVKDGMADVLLPDGGLAGTGIRPGDAMDPRGHTPQ